MAGKLEFSAVRSANGWPAEPFDPDKVRRADTDFPDENGRWWQATCVEAEDYDQLLALYREFVPEKPCYICGKEAKSSKARTTEDHHAVCMECWNSA